MLLVEKISLTEQCFWIMVWLANAEKQIWILPLVCNISHWFIELPKDYPSCCSLKFKYRKKEKKQSYQALFSLFVLRAITVNHLLLRIINQGKAGRLGDAPDNSCQQTSKSAGKVSSCRGYPRSVIRDTLTQQSPVCRGCHGYMR